MEVFVKFEQISAILFSGYVQKISYNLEFPTKFLNEENVLNITW